MANRFKQTNVNLRTSFLSLWQKYKFPMKVEDVYVFFSTFQRSNLVSGTNWFKLNLNFISVFCLIIFEDD